MKTKWSKTWRLSRLPRKQRKYAVNAPLHVQHRLMGAHLSKDLRKKYGVRSISLRKGDKIKVMRGKFRGHTGEVDRVDLKGSTAYITGVEVTRRDGSKVVPPIKASKLMITDLNLNDKRRLKRLNKKEGSSEEKRNR